ncbi:MAG: sigma-70 family RNA polymerase sigma factor [Planctomycetia bacterium]|nr:sigma-70 family RNA polymerase sigma factor [Planctomycetia bacterium]
MNSSKNPNDDLKERASQLFLKHYEMIRSIAIQIAPNRHCQEDILQDAFVNFVQKANQWDLDSDVRPLLKKITRNAGLVHWHQYVRNLPETLRKIAEQIQAEAARRGDDEIRFNTDEKIEALEICKKRLTERCQLLIEAYYVNGIPCKDLAKDANVPVNTIHQALSRIRSVLKECIDNTLRGGKERL